MAKHYANSLASLWRAWNKTEVALGPKQVDQRTLLNESITTMKPKLKKIVGSLFTFITLHFIFKKEMVSANEKGWHVLIRVFHVLFMIEVAGTCGSTTVQYRIV